jgi:lipoyl(octanoyl) transferase
MVGRAHPTQSICYTSDLMLPSTSFPIAIVDRGHELFTDTYAAMRDYTDQRHAQSADQLWLVEHDPVYTLGLAADRNHVLNAQAIPVVQTDRGGEVTYHGPGQAVVYVLIDLKRKRRQGLVREFVHHIEQAVINTLAAYQVEGVRKPGAPGIYTEDGAKIAALGLKIRANGCTYHGVAFNVAMDLTPFSAINPCGYPNLPCVDLRTLGINTTLPEVQMLLAQQLQQLLS